MTNKSKDDSKDIKWDVQTELALFAAMMGHKPVGVNKHFQMALIVDKFTSALNKPVNSEAIWKHLSTLYDLSVLNEMDANSDYEEVDFVLPSQYASLQQGKEALAAEKKSKKSVKETPKREVVKETIKKETPKPSKEQLPKTPKATKPTPPPASTETPKVPKSKTTTAPPSKTRDSAKKVEPSKEKKEPRELKNLGTPEVKQSRTKETRSGNKTVKEESPIPTRRSLSTSMTSSAKRPTRGSMAGGDSKATSPAVSSASSRSSTPQPTPKRRRI